jgi:hypothetical protein
MKAARLHEHDQHLQLDIVPEERRKVRWVLHL